MPDESRGGACEDRSGNDAEGRFKVLCVRWYLRYWLNYRDLEEIMSERNLSVDHSTIARWVDAIYRAHLRHRRLIS